MQAAGGFESEFRRRLRAELDAVDVRVPARPVARARRFVAFYSMARPLAIALIAAIALGFLAASVTHSPDPGQWIQPGVWMRALGVAPPSTNATPPAQEPSATAEPSEAAQPSETPHPQSPEAEPTERPSTTAEPRQSPDSGGTESPGG